MEPSVIGRVVAGGATPVTVTVRVRPGDELPTVSTAWTCQVCAPCAIVTVVARDVPGRVRTATPSTITRYWATAVSASLAPDQLSVTDGPATRARSAGAESAGASGPVRSITSERGVALRWLPTPSRAVTVQVWLPSGSAPGGVADVDPGPVVATGAPSSDSV